MKIMTWRKGDRVGQVMDCRGPSILVNPWDGAGLCTVCRKPDLFSRRVVNFFMIRQMKMCFD